MESITFLLPGLLGSFPGLPKKERPVYPGIERIISRGSSHHFQGRSYYEDLCEHFNIEKSDTRDLPIAPLTRLVDGVDRPEGVWVRADPVYLAAGRSGLVLFPPAKLSLTQHDAVVLAATLEEVFREKGWALEVPFTNRWYLRLPHVPAIRTTEIDYVVGREIRHFMPEGQDKDEWITLLNEVQMVLHECDLNLEREKRGLYPVNSLWFWGAGELPAIITRQWSVVYTDDPVARGLAMLSATKCPDLPGDIGILINDQEIRGDVLVASTRLMAYTGDDLEEWLQVISELDNTWFQPVLSAISQGRLHALTIDTGEFQIVFDRRSLHKFWRRHRSVVNFLRR